MIIVTVINVIALIVKIVIVKSVIVVQITNPLWKYYYLYL